MCCALTDGLIASILSGKERELGQKWKELGRKRRELGQNE